ncbi:MAG: ABC-F family ATP-binding cassette domain-containing protein [Clostridiales bacterium]|nr:ABC-F family ATP-binding cassette domain-containing protein [Clostridiales bacterium]
MLIVNGLTMTLSRNMRVLAEDFSFSLTPGCKAVIIGEEGNGKSTLIKLLFDPALVEDYTDWSGEISWGGDKPGYLPQELSDDDRMLAAYDYMNAAGAFEKKTPAELAAITRQLGLEPDMLYSDKPMHTFSGGEKVKLQLARVLCGDPDALLLDEPSNDIDIETLQWLEAFIKNCRQPVLFVSHDETLIENTANMIIHLEQVRRKTVARHTVAKMPYSQYAARRENALAHQEQAARKEKADYDRQIARWREIYEKVDRQQSNISRGDPHGGKLLKKKMKSVKSQEKRYEKEKQNLTQIPDIEEAIFTGFDGMAAIPNSKDVLRLFLSELSIGGRLLARNVKLDVEGPEHIGIIGKNGAGKSTLLRMIAEQLLARSDIKASYMPQDYAELLDDDRTPVGFLCGNISKDEITRARTYLGSMKYTHDEMIGKISDLSGGQKAKLLFIKMVLDGSNVLILDEPTRNFSPLSGPVIRNALKAYRGAIISISHDRKYLREVCGRILRLTEEGLREVYEI